MAIIDADDFRIYTTPAMLSYGWPVYIGGSPVLNSTGGRIVVTPTGGTMVRRFPKMNRFAFRFIMSLGSGTASAARDLMKVNLNPAEMPASAPAVSSDSNASFELRIRSTNILITRRAYDAAGNPVALTQTIANLNGAFTAVANSNNVVEVMIDETATTGNVSLVINGTEIVSADYQRAIGAHACDKGYGYFGVTAGTGSGMIGRIGDLAIFTPESPTAFPMGERFFTSLVISTSAETVTNELVKDIPDISGLTSASVGVITVAHADINGAASTAVLELEQIGPDGSVYSAGSERFVAGTQPSAVRTASAFLTETQINSMRAKYRVVR